MGAGHEVGGWLATLARCARIGAVALCCVIVYGLAGLRRLAMWSSDRRAAHRARWRGRTLRWCFARLGGTFIKVGQIMSSRQDLFSRGMIDELRSLQDRVPAFGFRQVRRIVEAELHAPLERRFRELDPIPIAAGSVAQVHRAVLRSGDEVAVKVVRPGFAATARRDARIMLWLAHTAHALSKRARTVDAVGHVRSLVAGILAQADLRHERNNYERFRRNFAGTGGLRFPRVYKRYSTRHILTMEFIHGVRVDEARAEHLPEAIRVIRSSFFAMCFDHGFVHADLHPGNLLVGPDGGVVMIDVGLVKRLPRRILHQIADFTKCLAAGSASDLVDHLRSYHRYLEHTDWTAVEADAAEFVDRLRARSLIELELGVVIGELFALARKHHIRPMPETTLVLLGMVTNEGMAKRFDPHANVIGELARFLGPRVPAYPVKRRRITRGSRDFVSPATTTALPMDTVPQPIARGPVTLPEVVSLRRKRARRRSLPSLDAATAVAPARQRRPPIRH